MAEEKIKLKLSLEETCQMLREYGIGMRLDIQQELNGVAYTPCRVSIPDVYGVEAGQTVQIAARNGQTVTAYVMKKTTRGLRADLQCTGNARRDSSGAINDQTPQQVAQGVVDAQTPEDALNKLTDNGKIQGIYVKDGTLYINAELAKIINLIADHVKSAKGNQTVEIDGGKLDFYIAGLLYASLRTNKLFGGGSLDMYSYKDGTTAVTTEMHGSGFFAESNEEVFGMTNVVQIGIDPKTGVPYADFPRLNDMNIYWERNGDGTFTLKGTEV